MSLTLRQLTTDHADAHTLLSAFNADMWERYPEERHQLPTTTRLSADLIFIVAYHDERPVGCGGYRPIDAQTVEIKRMYTTVEARGNGVATAILTQLERWAVERGFSTVILETAIRQPAAMRLYERCGYMQRDCAGYIPPNPLSRCYEKQIV